MRTSDKLPEECREEIKTHIKEVLDSWRKQGERGGLEEGSKWLLKGWDDALAWILGEDDQ